MASKAKALKTVRRAGFDGSKPAKPKVRKGDTVIVRTGKDKGRQGVILKVAPKENRAIVQGVNVVQRHTKPSQANEGGIVSKEAPIHISNLALIDPTSGKATRVGYKTLEDGSKVRVAKTSGETING